jgi:hypothetical protein
VQIVPVDGLFAHTEAASDLAHRHSRGARRVDGLLHIGGQLRLLAREALAAASEGVEAPGVIGRHAANVDHGPD